MVEFYDQLFVLHVSNSCSLIIETLINMDEFVNNIYLKYDKENFNILNVDLAYDGNACDLENINQDIQNILYKVFETFYVFRITIGIFSVLIFDDMG